MRNVSQNKCAGKDNGNLKIEITTEVSTVLKMWNAGEGCETRGNYHLHGEIKLEITVGIQMFRAFSFGTLQKILAVMWGNNNNNNNNNNKIIIIIN